MFVKIDDLEPKQIINFYLPQELKLSDVSLVLKNPAQAASSLLVGVLSVTGVTKILLTDKLLSVHYKAENKDDVRMSVLAELDDYFSDTLTDIKEKSNVSELEKAEALADAFIRPTLNRDKGDIEILSLSDGVLTIKFTGHCAGCPYAQNTLQNVIAKTMLYYMPQIQKIDLEDA
jgi:Fe-S cluster biogenesis protein NfuA